MCTRSYGTHLPASSRHIPVDCLHINGCFNTLTLAKIRSASVARNDELNSPGVPAKSFVNALPSSRNDPEPSSALRLTPILLEMEQAWCEVNKCDMVVVGWKLRLYSWASDKGYIRTAYCCGFDNVVVGLMMSVSLSCT